MREKRAKMSFEKGERQNETKTRVRQSTKTNLCGYQFNHLSLSLYAMRVLLATALSFSLSLSPRFRARACGVVVCFVLFVFHT